MSAREPLAVPPRARASTGGGESAGGWVHCGFCGQVRFGDVAYCPYCGRRCATTPAGPGADAAPAARLRVAARSWKARRKTGATVGAFAVATAALVGLAAMTSDRAARPAPPAPNRGSPMSAAQAPRAERVTSPAAIAPSLQPVPAASAAGDRPLCSTASEAAGLCDAK